MKIALKPSFNIFLWAMILLILKWKPVSDILSVTRCLQVFPSLSNMQQKENFSSKKSPFICFTVWLLCKKENYMSLKLKMKERSFYDFSHTIHNTVPSQVEIGTPPFFYSTQFKETIFLPQVPLASSYFPVKIVLYCNILLIRGSTIRQKAELFELYQL